MDSKPRSDALTRMRMQIEYWQTLGRFIEKFASMEATLLVSLYAYAKVTPQVGRAVFSGVRAKEAISAIKRIVEVTPNPREWVRELPDIFTHVSWINDARNLLVHHGTVPSGDAFKTTNMMRAHNFRAVKSLPVSPAILEDMIADLDKVIGHLLAHHMESVPPDDIVSDFIGNVLLDAWRYTPPQPDSSPNKTRGKIPKQQRPPKASRG